MWYDRCGTFPAFEHEGRENQRENEVAWHTAVIAARGKEHAGKGEHEHQYDSEPVTEAVTLRHAREAYQKERKRGYDKVDGDIYINACRPRYQRGGDPGDHSRVSQQVESLYVEVEASVEIVALKRGKPIFHVGSQKWPNPAAQFMPRNLREKIRYNLVCVKWELF